MPSVPPAKPTDPVSAKLLDLILALDQFKLAAGSNPPIQLVQAFCFVAAHNGCLQQDLQAVTGMSESSCSRMLMWLATQKASGERGLGLVKAEPDPSYYKRKRLYLTDKGKKLASLIAAHLVA